MFNLIKESFKTTNKYIAFLVTPLVLFSFLSSLYLILSSNGGRISMLLSIGLFILMVTAFISGWLYMITKCVKNTDIEDSNTILTNFASGVGEYFLSVIGMLFNIFITCLITYTVAQFIGMHFIGDMGISAEALKNSQTNIESARNFYSSLSPEQITKLLYWSVLSLTATVINSFIFLFYAPVIFLKTKNPFKALFIAIKDLFSKRILKNILMFMTIFISYVILSIITGIMSFNLFTQFIITLVNFYYAVLITIFVFKYYYTMYVKID